MKQLLIAGASGYLGQHLVNTAKKRGYRVRVLLRREPGSDMFEIQPDEVFRAEAVRPETLDGLCDGIDCVISSLGITRQKDGLSYEDVDYGANKNILDRALEAGVDRFVYVSVFNARLMLDTRLVAAKEHFVDELRNTGIDSTVIRPSGFFSDMGDFLDMAAGGKVYLFGDGGMRLNPIHGDDLAGEILNAMEQGTGELNIGGPETFTVKQIGELALDACGKGGKVILVPDFFRKAALTLLPLFPPLSFYGPLQFFLSAMGHDGAAPEYGERRLGDFFKSEIEKKV